MTPAKWHDGTSISKGISTVRWTSRVPFRTAAYLGIVPVFMAWTTADSTADPSPPPKLVTLRLTDQRSGAFVLVAKDQSPLFQIVGFCDHVQVIAATGGTTSWAAAKEATATIPIVLQGRWRPRQVRFSGQLQPAWRQRNGGRQSMINEISHHCWRDCIRSLPTGIRPGRFWPSTKPI